MVYNFFSPELLNRASADSLVIENGQFGIDLEPSKHVKMKRHEHFSV